MSVAAVPQACGNCDAASNLEVLNAVDAEGTCAMTSDARRLAGKRFVHYLCRSCGCIGIGYEPADALETHYLHEYDLSDAVQDNLVVRDGRAEPKKPSLHAPLMRALELLSDTGVRVLEVACGRGQLIQAIASSRPSWECTGIDPSGELPTHWPPETGRAGFIRAFFHESELLTPPYDVIIAHGFLNRSPPLKALARTRVLCRAGGLLSLEVMILEDSVHAPRVWDHSYMYLEPVLEMYLSHCGFKLVERQNNGTTLHVLCEASERSGDDLSISDELVAQSSERFREHEQYWSRIDAAYLGANREPRATTYLYGAGMFNSILIGKGGSRGITAVIDDTKAGSEFHGLPVIALSEARAGGTVLICARPHYQEVLQRKAIARGLRAVPLSGQRLQ